MAWNMSKAKRQALVKLQLRDKNGRFIEMGGGVKWYSSKLKKEIGGTVVDYKGQNAIVQLNDDHGKPLKGAPVPVPAHILEVVDAKASLDAPSSDQTPEFEKPEAVGKLPNPKDDPNYDATMEKYGQHEDGFKPYLNVTKTSDGNTYISVPEGGQLYTPAKELAVGDEVIAPHGAHPQKPFSMGKAWATKDAERVNQDGPKIGKVISIKEHAYAVVQLPEGETVESTQNPGEQVNTVTIGLSNKVIKATPELKASLKDAIPEPVYSAPEAAAPNAENDAKQAKRLDMLENSPEGTTVSANDGSIKFTKKGDNTWSSTNGKSGQSSEDVNKYVNDVKASVPEGSDPVGFTLEQPTDGTTTTANPEADYNAAAGADFAQSLEEEPTFNYGLKGDESFGNFDAYNPVELAALRAYVGSSAASNTSLRTGKLVSGPLASKKIARTILGLDSIMDRSVLQDDATVFRGVGADSAMLDAILNSGVMRDRAFTSTSVDKALAEDWVSVTGMDSITPVLMEITLPKGFKAHKVDYTAVGNGFDEENEVILPRGIEFDITGAEEYTNSSGQKGYRVTATPILNENNYVKDANDGTASPAETPARAIDPGAGGNSSDPGTGPATGTDSPAASPDSSGEQPSGQVHVDAGSGDVPDTGGSGPEAPAEPSPEASGPDDGTSGLLAPENTNSPLRRSRETIMSELQPIDTSNWKKVGSQAGSNPGGVFEDENGKKWYVKQSKSDAHARSEVLADQLYKATGIDASGLKLTTFNGKMGTASPMIEGAQSDLYSKYSDKNYMDKIREGFAVDAWLANWDVLGQGDDNIVTDSHGNPVRIDTGGTMMYRAQGGLKNDIQDGAWGNEVKDWEGLRKFGEAQKAFKDITDQQLKDSAARVESVTPEEIDAMVDALGYKGAEAFNLKNTLKARREDIINKAASLEGDQPTSDAPEANTPQTDSPQEPQANEPFEPVLPSQQQKSAPEAPSAADEPFEPVLPSQKSKPKFPKATKENPNVLQGYTMDKNEDGVYFPKERLSMEAWNGLRKGTIVPPNLPFIPFPTDSGEVHYWDSEGNRHWGQFGGAGALTRRKNADGEWEYLLAQRASTLSTAPNMWSTPGGAHTSKADSQGNGVTAKIELEEELGMVVHGEPVANYKHATAPDWSYDYSIFDSPESGEPDMSKVDKREIQDLQWMTASEIKSLKEDGSLHPAMSEVLDDLLNASESVDTDAPETSAPESDSNAPEAPSQAADDASDPVADAATTEEPVSEAPAEDPASTEELPKVETDGPSATMADGKQAYVGTRVAHKKLGSGTVIQIIAGKSAKIKYDDGTVKIAQAHLINSFDGKPVANAPVDTSSMSPGDVGNNPANGKLFIVGADGKVMYQGDKVEATHQGESKTGVIKGIYTTVNSVAIVFDGEKKPVTKKAAVAKSLEAAPEVTAPEAPSTESNSSKYNEDGYTAEEAKIVDQLERELSDSFKGIGDKDVDDIESELDKYYAKADARLGGKPEPVDIPVQESAPEAEKAPEGLIEPDTAPEVAPEAPEKAPAPVEVPSEVPDDVLDVTDSSPAPDASEPEAPADEPINTTDFWDHVNTVTDVAYDAPAGSKLVSKKLGVSYTKNDEGVKWLDEESGSSYYPDTLMGGQKPAMDWEVVPPNAGVTADSVPHLSTLDISDDGNHFVKTRDGDWELRLNGQKTGIKANSEQIDAIAANSTHSIVPSKPQEPAPVDTPDDSPLDFGDDPYDFGGGGPADVESDDILAQEQADLKDLYDGNEDWQSKAGSDAAQAEQDAKAEADSGAAPTEELADWEKELLGMNDNPEAPNNFSKTNGVHMVAPTGAELDELYVGAQVVTTDPDEHVYTKVQKGATGFGDGVWKDETDFYVSSEELANGADMKVTNFGQQPQEEITAELEFNDLKAQITDLPVGATIGDTDNEYFVKDYHNSWKPMKSGIHTGWVANKTDMQIAEYATNADEFHISTVKPNGVEPVNENVAKITTDLANLPIGTKIGDPAEVQYVKMAPNEWTDWFAGDKIESHNYDDANIASLVDGTQKFPMDSVILPEGEEIPEDIVTEPGTLGGLSKEDFKKLPVGSKVVYSDTKKASEPTGTYEKTSNTEWQYTPEGSETPSKTGITWDNFDHLFDAQVDNSSYSIDNKRTPSAPEEEAPNLTGVSKHLNLWMKSEVLDNYPIGTVLKKEKHSSIYSPNNYYWVKQEDGNWQQFKKTDSKVMKGEVYNSPGLANIMQWTTASEPISPNHAVTGKGELVYEGDSVFLEGDLFTIEKINKTSINGVSADGTKMKLKAHGMVKDTEFGKPDPNQGYSNSNGSDPLSKAANDYNKAQQKKLEAKLAVEKLQKDLAKFSGASADEYDAQGVEMPSNPAPKVDNGLTVMESASEIDTSDPWYGKPKPIQPPDMSSYPPFQPPHADPLPKWDSDAWLEKVKQRYLDNPNKAKSSVEQSNKWSSIQAVLNGEKGQLDSLVTSMYLDDDLRKEAEEGIDAQEKANVPLKKKIVDEANAAKEEYTAERAAYVDKLDSEIIKWDKDLKSWIKANPSPDAQKQAKKPPVSTKNAVAGEADWTTAHIGTYTAKSVFDSIRDDNVLGKHGLSIATDSDQIEDLDVKVTKVLNSNGDPKFELKFKLTAPYGKAFAESLKGDDKVQADDYGIYPTHMVLDMESGLMKESGKPGGNFINAGTRYVFTDEMTGAKITFQKASYDNGYNVSSNDNTVKIHMPLDATPEMYQQTLENLGIKKARPSTEGDIKVLAENKLISMMGTHQGDVKTFDGRINMSGADRKKALDKIAQDYGIVPEDLTFSTEPNGRVRFTLSDEKAQALAKKYEVTHFKHDVSGSYDKNRWVNMLSGKNPGMLSTYHRFTEGIGGEGKSSDDDMSNGAGDYNYITPQGAHHKGHNNVGVVIKSKSIFKRMDWWANPSDGWGKKAEGGKTSNVSPYKLFDQHGKVPYDGYSGGGIYEILPKDTIPLSDWAYVVIDTDIRKEVIADLQAKGILQINGFPLESFIIAPGGTPPVDLTVPGAA